MSNPQFIRTITVLPVNDIQKCYEWYGQVLGLKTVYLHEGEHESEPTNYAVLERDGIQIHLILDELPKYGDVWTKAGTGYLYLKVNNVKEIYESAKSSGATVSRELQKEPWGATAFNLTDPSGNSVHVEEE
ncbi:VOC family protein [Fulvivirgaceae bacterium BMA12]|uniref:VOC family protein n=1 Tax=Agaribacillus aureus TaxID=3051825 RepID=A0ABT8LJ54_9BACT|nr:VOC family protein [Fulvivirgaceae bacterium BMA12]